ncbi:CMRF35-like molecule 8 isoform X2 [Ictalurus punctatus]|uniref:CMRF35-like molecule 8 isoform X2 n=1 Tax=Ictalurus punctatus TaxID=7998 RepID=A0A2D0SLS6_ICTPU|nr:CMRF35-like molecule 8 isoform X2 [Ictalurus punctatus]
MMTILLIFTLSLISGPVGCVDVIGYSGGSVIMVSKLSWSSVNSNYICKMENIMCTDILRSNTGESNVQVERFRLYRQKDGFLTMFIRRLKPQDAGRYSMRVATRSSTDVTLKVVNDSCCSGPNIMNAYQGQNTTIICNYPAVYEKNNKHIIKIDKDSVIKHILEINSQNGRFSVSDDRSAKVLIVNIGDVREADDGVYLCGAHIGQWSVQYFSFFTEIQLHVTATTTSMMTSATPTEISSDAARTSTVTVIISVCVCVALLLIGGFALMVYKLRHKRRQGLTPSSNNNNQVPHAAWIYEEINHTNHVSDSDTDIYMNASSPTNPDKEISSTVQPPQDQNLTYTTVSFKKNPDDAAVTFSKEESATEYATVQHHSGLE